MDKSKFDSNIDEKDLKEAIGGRLKIDNGPEGISGEDVVEEGRGKGDTLKPLEKVFIEAYFPSLYKEIVG